MQSTLNPEGGNCQIVKAQVYYLNQLLGELGWVQFSCCVQLRNLFPNLRMLDMRRYALGVVTRGFVPHNTEQNRGLLWRAPKVDFFRSASPLL